MSRTEVSLDVCTGIGQIYTLKSNVHTQHLHSYALGYSKLTTLDEENTTAVALTLRFENVP